MASAQQMIVAAQIITIFSRVNSIIKCDLGIITVFLCLGQASSATAEQSGKMTEFMSNLAWEFAVKEGFRIFKEMPAAKPLTRSYHTWAGPRSLPSTPGTRSYTSLPEPSSAHASKGALVISPEGLSPPVRELYQRLEQFMDQYVYPAEPELQRHQASAERWTPSPLVEDLKVKQLFRSQQDSVKGAEVSSLTGQICPPTAPPPPPGQ